MFLNKVRLSGYKTIVDTSIDFEDGLNIIIGKNASGKTNFMKFLNQVLDFSLDNFYTFAATMEFENSKKLSLSITKNHKDKKLESLIDEDLDIEIKINNKKTSGKKLIETDEILRSVREKGFRYYKTFICHGVPSNYMFIDSPQTIKFFVIGGYNELFSIINNNDYSKLSKQIALNLFLSLPSNFENQNISLIEAEKRIRNSFSFIKKLNDFLRDFTPIREVRFNPNINIFEDEKGNITVNNIFIEFNIDGIWHPFSELSDGTKRMFYILSEILIENEEEFIFTPNLTFTLREKYKSIVLIEEPELGIHPHQFMRLMEFLKIQAREKQIIITTHSPQSLNILKEDELQKIIIIYSLKHETHMRHLSKEEVKKAKVYIEQEFLSDYWVYSDLEK